MLPLWLHEGLCGQLEEEDKSRAKFIHGVSSGCVTVNHGCWFSAEAKNNAFDVILPSFNDKWTSTAAKAGKEHDSQKEASGMKSLGRSTEQATWTSRDTGQG